MNNKYLECKKLERVNVNCLSICLSRKLTKLLLKLIMVMVLGCTIISPLLAQANVKEAIVKVYSVYNRHSYYRPWQMSGQRRSSGSGCIIGGRRILTSAHVVADYTFIQVKRAGEAKKYTAEVEIVAHECDLAILKVKDNSFFSGVEPLEIGALAEVRDKVAVYGFPQGGDELCITEGVVSRVEHHKYTHSSAYLLSCQIDAAINSGSSGGPVVKNNKIVGVAFQAGSGENIGYMVPVTVINHFLKDIEDGEYDGIPGLGVSWQDMENPDMRLKYNMNENHTGILVNKVYPDSPAKGVLKSGDIIISIEGENIANDGTVEFRKNERTFLGYLIQNKYIDDTIEFEILRDNKVMNVKIKLSIPINYCRLVPYEQYDIAPTYYIVGGFLFEPLTLNYLKIWDEKNVPCHLLNYYYNGEPTDDRREVIVLTTILADEINVGYHNLEDHVISYVNGKKISTMEDLVKAIERNEGEYYTIVDEWENQIVLKKSKIDERNKIILDRYKIDSDRSEDLRGL